MQPPPPKQLRLTKQALPSPAVHAGVVSLPPHRTAAAVLLSRRLSSPRLQPTGFESAPHVGPQSSYTAHNKTTSQILQPRRPLRAPLLGCEVYFCCPALAVHKALERSKSLKEFGASLRVLFYFLFSVSILTCVLLLHWFFF